MQICRTATLTPQIDFKSRTETPRLRLAKYRNADAGSAGVSPAVARASCPRTRRGGTPQRQRPGRPRYTERCHAILQASVDEAQSVWDEVPNLAKALSREDFASYAQPYCDHRRRLAEARRALGQAL